MQFNQLGLSETVLAALAAKGYSEATPIQAQAIPSLLEGKDLLGIAQTGTGKTAAFMLPSIDRLVASGQRAQPRGCRMLILAPTRELAAQIAQSARDYSRGTRLSVMTVFGGTSLYRNKQDLARGVDILVATPGRLVDLMDSCHAVLMGLEILVLDEADQMMDLGFIHALKRIVRDLPAKRQTLFFSATMPKTIRDLAGQFIRNDATEVKVTPVSSTVERVAQSVTFVQQGEKQALLTLMLQNEPVERALVFTRTKHGADRVVRLLAGNGIASSAIHGNKSQPQRERALADFRQGRVKVLIATDIAARGIDVSGVSHVFNFELPNVPEQYVHRIGRTARAGADGIAVSFCAPDERAFLRDIEKLTRQKVEIAPLPEGFVQEAAKLKATAKPVPISPDEANGRNGRAMQHQRGPRPQSQPRFDANRPDQRPNAPRPEQPRADAPRRFDANRPDQRRDAPRPEQARGEAPRRFDASRPDQRRDAPRPEQPRGEAPRRFDTNRPDQRRPDAPRTDAPRGDAPRNYARPKGKFHARPANGGQRNNAGRPR